MLKYQVRTPRNPTPSSGNSPSTSQHRTIISIRADEQSNPSSGASSTTSSGVGTGLRASTTSLCSSSNSSFASSSSRRYFRTRSNSLSSLSSLDSSDFADWGQLRIFTGNIKSDTDYKTLKVSTQTTSRQIIEQLLAKFRLTSRDLNLYQLWMEVSTRRNGAEVKTLLELDATSRPLELQRCHPVDQSRFVLNQSNGVLVRVHDSDICSESNYKSLLVSPKTATGEIIQLLLQMARLAPGNRRYRLMLVDDATEAEIPEELPLAPVYLNLRPGQRIVIRK